MPRFNVGDRVTFIEEYERVPVGMTGTVIYVGLIDGYVRVFLDKEDKDGVGYFNYDDMRGRGWSVIDACLALFIDTPRGAVDRELDKQYADF